METSRKSDAIQCKEEAIDQLAKDFIMALSRDYVRFLGGVDIMTAYVRATGYLRSLSSAQLSALALTQCSDCDFPKKTES